MNLQKDKALIFASQAIENSRKFIDFDIGIKSSWNIDSLLISDIKEVFESTKHPHTVGVVDYSHVSDRA